MPLTLPMRSIRKTKCVDVVKNPFSTTANQNQRQVVYSNLEATWEDDNIAYDVASGSGVKAIASRTFMFGPCDADGSLPDITEDHYLVETDDVAGLTFYYKVFEVIPRPNMNTLEVNTQRQRQVGERV